MPRSIPVSSSAAPTTTPAQVLAAAGRRAAVVFQNAGAADIAIGAAGVTASTGYLLPGGQSPPASLPLPAPLADGSFWAVTPAGTGDLRILEFR